MKEERQIGLFSWIREGVRRAVLLGFSDAMTEVGSRSEDEDFSPRLAESLRDSASANREAGRLVAASSNEGGRKRLGRSLEQLNQAAAKPA